MIRNRSGKARTGLIIAAAGTLLTAVAAVAAALVLSKRALKRPDAPAPAPVQSVVPGPVQQSTHLSVRPSVERARTAGGPTTLVLEITPAPKVHIYAPGQQGYIPVELTLESSPHYSPGPVSYPEAETVMLPAIQERARVYNQTFQVKQPIALVPASAGSPKLRAIEVVGRLRYQACDDLVCYRPETLNVVWTVTVE